MPRRSAGRATRQILSGSHLAPPREPLDAPTPAQQRLSLTLQYFIVLAALVIAAAIIWAIWGMAPASPILLLLALGLIGSWLVL
jgi:hypothetical protein